MADEGPTAAASPPAAAGRTGAGFELRLERGGVHVLLDAPAPAGGLTVEALDLLVPGLAAPVDAGRGPGQFQSRLCELVRLAVRIEPEAVAAATARLDLPGLGLAALEVALREGFAEVAGRLAGGPAFALRLGLLPGAGRGLTPVAYLPRLFGPSNLPAAALPHLAARALAALGLPEDPLPALLRAVLAPRGWKVPRAGEARLGAARVAPDGLRLAWDRDPRPAAPAPPPDPDLLAALEGGRAFAAAEERLARGDLAAARDAYLAAPGAAAHPFGADRLLSLLCLDERFHDEALDLSDEWLARRPGFPAALAAQAWIRAVRGEPERAAGALAALAEGAVEAGERLAAAAAAGAALDLPGAGPAATARAVDAALAVKRDHLPALRALRDLARRTGDRGAELRAIRRLLAYAPTDAEKARAHGELGALLIDKDPPAARLHLDRAIRLSPGDEGSLATLAAACRAAGEPLRAVRALDGLRELRLAAGDAAAAARLGLEAGELWETALGHPENALLRYREAAELAPGEATAHARAAACAGRLGRWAEAADHHAGALAALDRADPASAAAAAAHHLALAEVAERRLDDPAGAATHLEAALATGPAAPAQLERLAGLHRRLGRPAALLATLDRLAPAVDPAARVPLLVEAGELARRSLGRPELARARHAAALAIDPACRPALEGLAAAAADLGDVAGEREALARLLAGAGSRAEEAALGDRLAAACERAGDLAGAARAISAARRAEPSRSRLAAEVALARRAGDAPALAGLLAEVAGAAAAAGDAGEAVEAWRERAELLGPGDPPLALAALAEALALAPDDAGLRRRQAELAARAGDPALALAALAALLATAPPDAPALELQAARAALDAGAAAEAAAHAGRALAAGAEGALALLDAALAAGGDDAGRAALLERTGRPLEAAGLWERTGDLGRALPALAAAAAAEATADEALERLAALRRRIGDAAGAAEALLARARRAGGGAGARRALEAHALAPSEAALDAAVACDPACAPALAARAALRAAGRPAEALADAEAALAAGPLEPAERIALHRLAARLAAGAPEVARRHLAALPAPTPAEAAALADLHRAAGDDAALARALELRLAQAPPGEALPVLLELAALLDAAGRGPEALRRWREALDLDPGALPALRALLDPARAGLDPAERERLAERLAAHGAAPAEERAAALAGLAAARDAAGDLPGALAALRRASALREEDDAALERRAALAARAGEAAEAAAALLRRAARARDRRDEDAGARLAEAGLAALAAGLGPEGEAALRDALALPLEPEGARDALGALAGLAAGRGDAAGEAEALARLVPLLPTGERPARLLRLAALRTAAGDAAGALAAAEGALTLSPRDPATARATRLAAAAAGDREREAALLAVEARLAPEQAGELLLARARVLARAGDAAGADDAYAAALPLGPPDLELGIEAALHRRRHLPARSPAGPVEAIARRAPDPASAARGYRLAAALALAAAEPGAALRCARRAFGRSRERPAFAGPLLARLLYLQGSSAEALAVHRVLLDGGLAGVEPGEEVALCRQLAELAADAGEIELALRALDRLLALRPGDAAAAADRFELDGDRRRAVAALARAADPVRSETTRRALLERAGTAALVELRDREAGERIFRALRAGARDPAEAAGIEARRAAATRAADLGPDALLSSLHDAADAAQAAGRTGAARALLEEAIAEELARGMKAPAAQDLAQLDALLAADGEFERAAACALQAGRLLAEAGDVEGAEEALRRILAERPEDAEAREALLALLARGDRPGERARLLLERARGAAGPARAADLAEAARLLERGGPEDRSLAADALRAIADEAPGDLAAARAAAVALLAAGRRGEAVPLLAAVARAAPGDGAAAELLEGALAGRPGEVAELLLERAAAAHGEPRAALLRRAAAALDEAGDRARARATLAAAFDAWPADGEAFAAALEAAGADVDRIDALLAARAGAVPAYAHGCHRARADALFATGRFARAISAYREALAIDADDPAALAALGACLAEAEGPAAAADADRALCALATRTPGRVPASLEGEARYRLGLHAPLDAAAAEIRADLERALLVAPGDPRADRAFEALAAAHERLGDPAAALAAARTRAERATALGDPELERRALEAGAALADRHGDDGPDAAAILEALLARLAASGEAPEAVVPLAVRAARALRGAGDAARAAAALQLAGLAPRRAPVLVPIEEVSLEEVAPEPTAPVDLEPTDEIATGAPFLADPEPTAPVVLEPTGEPAADAPPLAAPPSAAALVAEAEELARGEAPAGQVRALLERAADADPDAAAPWHALAALEAAAGDPLAAARAHLAASIRSEGEPAAAAALTAATLFVECDRHAEAARALRAAGIARRGIAPPALVLAVEALAADRPEGAAEALGLLDAGALEPDLRRLAERLAARALPAPQPDLQPDPQPTPQPAPQPDLQPAPQPDPQPDPPAGPPPAALAAPPDPAALEERLAAARSDPSDGAALLAVAEIARRLALEAAPPAAVRLGELARLATALAAFLGAAPEPPPLPALRLPDEAREPLAVPAAAGPIARLLSLLTPYLEPLFPADLARRGAGAGDRLSSGRAPALSDPLEAMARLLGARPHAAFRVDRPGVEILIENTQPPALVVPSGLERLGEGARLFAAARALDLVGRGWALAGKFSPRDVAILLELACRFAGAAPPAVGLPGARAGAFLEALERSVPPSIAARAAALAPAAAAELGPLDVGELAAGIRQTSGRIALLATGDPAGALEVLRSGARLGEELDPVTALARPELRELALLALSDLFLDLRVAVIG